MVEQTILHGEPQGLKPEAAAKTKPIEISADTINEASKMLGEVKDNGKTSEQSVEQMLQSFEKDMQKGGINLTPEEKKIWKEKSKGAYSGLSKSPESTADPDAINLNDYADCIKRIHGTYDLKKSTPKFAAYTALMMGSNALAVTGELGMTNLIETTIKSAQELAKLESGELTKGKLTRTLIKAYGPMFLPLLLALPASVVDVMAQIGFEKELLPLKSMINRRVAESVFMRDFEFVHDKSAAEILNAIDKGKSATMNLLTMTYTGIIPELTGIFATVIPQLRASLFAGLYGAAKIPLLYLTSKEKVIAINRQRREELARKDDIDTRVLTSLGSLEVIKTSDSMDTAITQLEETMKEREELQTNRAIEQIKVSKKGDFLLRVTDIVAPFAAAGIKYVTTKDPFSILAKSFGNKDANASKQVEEVVSAFGEFFTKSSSSSTDNISTAKNIARGGLAAMEFLRVSVGQSIVNMRANSIINLFTNRIQPAIQDFKKMEELLGPYDQVDTPEGPKEKARMEVDALGNFDISVKNLSFKDILHDVSLDIPQGSFVTIKGPSGIGKTTFFRHLMGLYGAKDGVVQYGGVDLQNIKKFGEQSIYSKIAYANQNPQFFENMTLRENLLLWTKKPTTDIEIRQTLHDLRLDGLIDRMDSKVKHYSGGELRRIGIARALLKDPRVLFLDEPTANLDAESTKQVLEIIKGLRVKRPEMTVVAVTHDPSFEAIAERIVDFKEINRKPVEQVYVGEGDYNTTNNQILLPRSGIHDAVIR
ncbi:MAG: ATP-binding cassette domain-containing protein [Candidatus Gottesmanbacteria bacterium]|nr:ATP-binding cassette domain-containing protein [Candidatus Gottesmanbacteria bacterium]